MQQVHKKFEALSMCNVVNMLVDGKANIIRFLWRRTFLFKKHV